MASILPDAKGGDRDHLTSEASFGTGRRLLPASGDSAAAPQRPHGYFFPSRMISSSAAPPGGSSCLPSGKPFIDRMCATTSA